MNMPTTARILALLGWIGICFLVAAMASQFMLGEWYAGLRKPVWTPPNWLFGPVWTLLYLMMGIAAWLVWRQGGFSGARLALGLFLFQLVLNGLWSWLFFGLQRPGLASIEISVLWVAILATLIAFWRIIPMAGIFLIPYAVWVGFAAFLNITLFRMNR
jgi:tryptophan-rich sensory protein